MVKAKIEKKKIVKKEEKDLCPQCLKNNGTKSKMQPMSNDKGIVTAVSCAKCHFWKEVETETKEEKKKRLREELEALDNEEEKE